MSDELTMDSAARRRAIDALTCPQGSLVHVLCLDSTADSTCPHCGKADPYIAWEQSVLAAPTTTKEDGK